MALLKKDDYEDQRTVLELARQALRSVFVQGELDTLPELRVINGMDYKRLDDQLLAESEELERRWKITRYVASQGKQKKFEDTPRTENPVREIQGEKYRVVSSGALKSAGMCTTSSAFRRGKRSDIGDI